MSNVIKFEEFAELKAAIESNGHVVNDHIGGRDYPASEVDTGLYIKITNTQMSVRPFLILKNAEVGYSMNELYLDEDNVPHLSIMSVGPFVFSAPGNGVTLEDLTKGISTGYGLAYVHVLK